MSANSTERVIEQAADEGQRRALADARGCGWQPCKVSLSDVARPLVALVLRRRGDYLVVFPGGQRVQTDEAGVASELDSWHFGIQREHLSSAGGRIS